MSDTPNDLESIVERTLAAAQAKQEPAKPAEADQPPAWAAQMMQRLEAIEKRANKPPEPAPAPKDTGPDVASLLRAMNGGTPTGQYHSPAAPNGNPGLSTPTNPMTWSKQDVARFVEDGSLRQRVEKWAERSLGGGNAPFRRRIPK